MKYRLLGAASACLIALCTSFPLQAALVSRLNGQVVYDTDRNISWLSNANLAATDTFGVSGILTGLVAGRMTWTTANSWIAAMNAYNGTGYLGYSDWRLPHAVFPDAGCSVDGSGSTSNAGTGCSGGEMGHLFYDELGGTAGSGRTPGYPGDPQQLVKFSNIQAIKYWSDATLATDPQQAWTFSFTFGSQDALEGNDPIITLYAWAVRDGDVTPVPLPGALWLFGAGLLLLTCPPLRYRPR